VKDKRKTHRRLRDDEEKNEENAKKRRTRGKK
jgi:hypothetical protein